MILEIDHAEKIVYCVNPKANDSYWIELERAMKYHKVQDYKVKIKK